MYQVKIVHNHAEAASAVTQFLQNGFLKKHIYLFAHDKDESKQLADVLNTGEFGVTEQGLPESISNLFKSRGEELRSKFQEIGLNKSEAAECEQQLDRGFIAVIATKKSE